MKDLYEDGMNENELFVPEDIKDLCDSCVHGLTGGCESANVTHHGGKIVNCDEYKRKES